ncbi:hypothetical protein C8A01DRAFT_42837 [Parachaetomium inaequale]|uniref:RNA ligase domain-containing protein n=1 Tax=Parachaetomium inaequale TaxID=2588326 RepID=A0AAN6SVT2_9PEZI|nr:hypothetical protein C8A01DRAFT_42837 [Parachaetomium inaequale]
MDPKEKPPATQMSGPSPAQDPPTHRKLVSVRQISKIERVSGTGYVVLHLDGWQVVTPRRRPMYEVADLVLFFEIDSFIPKTERFWELFTTPDNTEVFRGKEGYRVKSVRYMTHLSQGLVYPLCQFPAIGNAYRTRMLAVGEAAAREELLSQSFARRLGVEKWEFTETVETLPNIGLPPAFIPLPGWWRIQDVEQTIFSRARRRKTWQITEKLDGVTMIVYKIANASKWADSLPALPSDSPPTMQDEHNRYGVCSRREDLIDRDDSLYWQTAKESGVLSKLPEFDLPNIAVQGELCGSSIEGNTMHYPEGKHEFIVFGMWDIDAAEYLDPRRVVKLCERFGIKHVPVVGYTSLGKYARDVQELLGKTEGRGQFGGVREGFVFNSMDGAERFKVISNSWLSLTGK